MRRRKLIIGCLTCSRITPARVKIEHTLRPFAVLMAGADVFDPFKD